MTEAQRRFLKTVRVSCEASAMQNSILAAFQHGGIYKESTGTAYREDFRCALRLEIRKIATGYSGKVGEETHCDNIGKLADSITRQFSKILKGDRFRIGTAQKALNLYLKFLWCLGIHPVPPPHCPLDRTILEKAGVRGAWTKLDCMKTYQEWIGRVKVKANGKSIGEWELESWQAAKPSATRKARKP